MNAIQEIVHHAELLVKDPQQHRLIALKAALTRYKKTQTPYFSENDRKLIGPRGSVHLGHNKAQLMAVLVKHMGQIVHHNTIVEAMYGGMADGGPDHANRVVRVIIYQLRRHLLETGVPLKITSQHSFGYKLEEVSQTLTAA